MILFFRSLKRALENTVIDKLIRVYINKLSYIYFNLATTKDENIKYNPTFIFICYGGMGDNILTIPLINKIAEKFNILILVEKKFSQIKNLICNNVNVKLYKKEELFFELKQVAKINKNYVLIQQSPILEFIVFHYLLKRPPVLGYIFSQDKVTFIGEKKFNKKVKSLNKIFKYQEISSFIDKFFKNCKNNKIKDYKNKITKLTEFNLLKNSFYILSPTKNAQWEMGFLEFNEYAKILIEISKKSQLTPVIVGIKQDLQIIEKITKSLPLGFKHLNLAGKTDIKQLISLIKNTSFVIANDNGIHHLSNFLQKKTLTLYNFSSPQVYNWNLKNSKYIFNPEFTCMPCIGNNKGPFDNYPFKCPWELRCKKTINSSTVMEVLYKLSWVK